MRAKLLFTVFALSALFASCAKEELPVVNMEPSDRAIVENVTFSETAATRLSYNGKYNFEAGDQIGACLMDEITTKYSSSSAKWNERFDLVDYIQTNYKFTRDAEGNWETEAKMCEGNYFLAFPYNANSGLREAYSFECADQVMDGTDDAALKSAFVKNNSFVGYAKVEANDNDHESVAIDMAPVFESTGIVLFNTGSQSYTIEKIVLSGAAVSTKAVVKPSQVESEVTTAGNFDFDNKDVLDYTDDENRIEVALTAGNTVESNSSIRVIVMSAPSAALTANAAVLEIHTDKGLIRGIDLSKKYTAANSDNSNTDKDAINVTTDKALGKLGAAEVVTVTFDDTSLDVPTTMNINNADELLRFIQWNSRVNKVAVTANLLANVELTAEMYNILSTEYVANGSTFAFTGGKEVTINADVEDGAIDWVKFEAASVKVKGTQTITKAFAANVTVNSGATLEVKAAVNAKVTNKGTVNVNIAKKSGKGDDYYTISELTNEATVNVAGHALYTALTNSKKASVVNVAENTTLNVTGTNKGTVENKGILDGALVNDVYVKSGNTVLFNPTINNYGEIKAVTNNNVIVMKDQKAKVLAAAGNGEINNTIGSKYIKTESNTVFVNVVDLKASELNTVVANANATKAYVSGTLTIDPAEGKTEVAVAKLTAIVADDDLTVTGNGKVYFSANPSFTVAAGTETLVENGATLSLGSGALTVDGKLVIENNATVICGAVTGETNVEAFGKFNHR